MEQYKKIHEILKILNISFDEIGHEPSTSCEHSKELREKAGLEWVGSKNIIFHAKWKFYLVTTLWDKDIKARKFKKEFGTKDIRFASQEEITSLWLGVIGSIAPFWFENIEVPVFVDSEIFEHEYFMFNPSDAWKSVRVRTQDLKKIYENMKNEVKFFTLTEEELIINE